MNSNLLRGFDPNFLDPHVPHSQKFLIIENYSCVKLSRPEKKQVRKQGLRTKKTQVLQDVPQ